MTVITPAYATIGTGAKRVTWEGLAGGDTGKPVKLPKYPEKTIQIYGDFNSGTGTLEGSNDPRANPEHVDHASAVWFTMKDVGEALISKVADGAETVGQSPEWVRPSFAGSGGNLDFSLVARKS